jgi:hypothetical protein
MGPCVVVDYNFTLCSFQSRLQQIYHGQTNAGVDIFPQSWTLDLASASCGISYNTYYFHFTNVHNQFFIVIQPNISTVGNNDFVRVCLRNM